MFSFVKYFMAKFLKKARLVAVKDSFVHSSSKLESGTFFLDPVWIVIVFADMTVKYIMLA